MSEREVVAVVLAAAFRRGRRSQPVICGEMIWLNDEWPTYSRLRRMLLRRLLAKADALLIVTEGGARELRRILPDVAVQAYQFGIPSSVFAGVCRSSNLAEAVRSGRPARVLVAGNDLRRDWETVARALGGDKRFEVRMLSRREQVATYEAFGSNCGTCAPANFARYSNGMAGPTSWSSRASLTGMVPGSPCSSRRPRWESR